MSENNNMTEEDVQALMAEANNLLGNGPDDTIGKIVMDWFSMKSEVEAIKAGAKDLTDEMAYLEQQIIDKMEAAEIDKVSTAKGSITLTQKSMPSPEDFYAFVKWVAQDVDNRIGFLTKKVSEPAVNEYLQENGSLPPGIKTYIKPTLTKRKSK